jgi:hypothetical protein
MLNDEMNGELEGDGVWGKRGMRGKRLRTKAGS